MFHTRATAELAYEAVEVVVIPWRGFRCFTQGYGVGHVIACARGVVIPWRGFRCFTREFLGSLRCVVDGRDGCNPLAGI